MCLMRCWVLLSLIAAAEADMGLVLVQLKVSSVEDVDAKRASKPHIIFILADDLGWNGVGYHNNGTAQVKTPFIDELAASGVRLESYYTFCYCAPSRMALLTGRDPWKSEAGYENFRPDIPIGTSLAYKMLPAALKAAGYSTHMIGKWHQGFHMQDYLPTNRGFDKAYGIMEAGTHHFDQTALHFDYEYGDLTGFAQCKYEGRDLVDMLEDGLPAKDIAPGILSDDRYRERVNQLIYNHDKKTPLFLYLSLQLPHDPFEVTPEYSSKYNLSQEENVYWGMHSHVDDTVKLLVEALKARDMFEDSLIVFSSDNGADSTKSVEPFAGNFPLNGHKGTLWDGGIRVPAFVAGGYIKESANGKILNGIMGVQDWYATLAHVAGAQVDNDGPFPSDSINNWQYIVGDADDSARKSVILHYHALNRTGRFPTAVVPFGPQANRVSVMRKDNLKMFLLVDGSDGVEHRLFDVVADPGERNNLAIGYPNVPQWVLDAVDGMEAEMNPSWNVAYHQSWFRIGQLDVSKKDSAKACASWLKNGGYLTPWADSSDEMKFQVRIQA